MLSSISLAKKLEGKLRAQSLEKKLLGINQVLLIDDAWEKYLSWAKTNKKSWRDGQSKWQHHIEPILGGRKWM